MDIIELLEERSGMMTEKQRKISRFMIENPEMMCYLSLKELGNQIGCTEVTLLRFCTRLGFNNFGALKDSFRARLKEQNSFLRTPSRPTRSVSLAEQAQQLRNVSETDAQSAAQFYQFLDLNTVSAAAEAIFCAEQVVLFYEEAAVGHLVKLLQTYLIRFGIPTQTACASDSDELRSCSLRSPENQAVIFFDLQASTPALAKLARRYHETHCHIITFTDSLNSFCASESHIVLNCIAQGSAFTSLSRAMMVMHLLLSALAVRQPLDNSFLSGNSNSKPLN